MTSSTRRTFLKHTLVAAASAAAPAFGAPAALRYGRADKIRMGFIGVGNRGSQLLGLFLRQPDVDVAALCDVYEPYVLRERARVHPRWLAEVGSNIPRMGETFARPPDTYKDFRKLLERKDIDAVCIATPDHWHALQAIQAMEAGKDVYVEKPLTITVREGRAMVRAAERTGRVAAVGLNRRGSSVYQNLARAIPAGAIGKATVARAYRINNMYPNGIGIMQPEPPPADFDWDLWLGPRASRPYQYNIAPYKFRWWKDYSSQMGNWGVHFLDVIRWLMQEQAPIAISAHGGKYAVRDDRTIPDTMEVTFEFGSGAMATFGIYEAGGGGAIEGGEIELRGTRGNLQASENGYRIAPVGPGQFQEKGAAIEPVEYKLSGPENSTAVLVRDFLDCVKSRQAPLCPLEEGHRSTCFAHLANIALETGERLRWDAAREEFTNHTEANRMLHYEYRAPWRLDVS